MSQLFGHRCAGWNRKHFGCYRASSDNRIRDTFGLCVFASGIFLVCLLVKRSLHPRIDYSVDDSGTGDPQLVAEPGVGRNHGWAMGKS